MPTVVDAPRVKISNNDGKLYTGIQHLRLLAELQRKGLVEAILTYPQLDEANTILYNKLPGDVQKHLVGFWARGRTIGGKPEDGGEPRRIGEFYVFASKDASLAVEVVVPRIVLDQYPGKARWGRGAFWDVSSNNTTFTIHSDLKSVTAQLLNPEDAVAPKLVPSCTWGMANGSTRLVPSEEVLDGNPERRYNCMSSGEAAGALGCGRLVRNPEYSQYVGLHGPGYSSFLPFIESASLKLSSDDLLIK